jgi:hypothetical protein
MMAVIAQEQELQRGRFGSRRQRFERAAQDEQCE